MKRKHTSVGMGMIEIMISLAIVALASLSVCMMRMQSSNADSLSTRQQAAWRLISELAVWLRNGGDKPLQGLPQDPALLPGVLQDAPDCYRRACSAADSALFYLGDWHRRLSVSVPGARLMVCRGHPVIEATRWDWPCSGAAGDASVLWLKLGWPAAGNSTGFAPRIFLPLSRA